MRTALAAVLVCLSWSAHADGDISKVNGAIRVEAGRTVGEVSSVNGSVRLEEGVTANDIDTVNGSIHIGARSSVGEIDTVNGSITVGEDVKARAIESVNGGVRIGASSEVAGDATCVNGAISLGRGSRVDGNVENVNGSITLEEARVRGRLKTTNGVITVGAKSVVNGGILVEKPSFSFFNRNSRKPKIVIGPEAVVEGTLDFEREVELYVSDTAQIGRVKGANPILFSGDDPSHGTRTDDKVER